MKLRTFLVILIVISIVALATISCGRPSEVQTANTGFPQPSVTPSPGNTQNKSHVVPNDESNSDKTRQSKLKPPRSGVLTGIVVDEVLGPRWRAIIVETKGTRFYVLQDIAKSAYQTDAEYLSLRRSYPKTVIGDLEVGAKVRITYTDRHDSDMPGADWSLDATRIVEIRNPKSPNQE
jgi:hypothetical protein